MTIWGRRCLPKAGVLLAAVLCLVSLVSACTGGHHRAQQASAEEQFLTFATMPPSVPDVTRDAREANGTLADLARTVRSWPLDSSVTTPLVQQIAYAAAALQQGNLLGARALLAAWTAHVQDLAHSGMIPAADDTRYRQLAAGAEGEIPERGRVTPFPRSDAPPVVQATRDCGGANGVDAVTSAIHTFVPYMLAAIPEVGWALAGLYAIVWPPGSGDSATWDCFYDAVHQVLQKVNEDNQRRLRALIEGLKADIQNYVAFAQAGEAPQAVYEAWSNANGHLSHDAPQFYGDNAVTPQELFLPEFAQFANLQLASLREGFEHGAGWGLTQNTVNRYRQEIADTAKRAVSWKDTYYPRGRDAAPFVCRKWVDVPANPPAPKSRRCFAENIDQFNSENDYDKLMIPAVSDQAFNWPYFSPDKGPVPPNKRVIFSSAFGTGAKSFAIGGWGISAGPISPDHTARDPITEIGSTVNCKENDCQPGTGSGLWISSWMYRAGDWLSPAYGAPTRWNGAYVPVGSRPTGHQAIVKVDGFAGKTSSEPLIYRLQFTRAGGGEPLQAGDTGKKPNFSASFGGEVLASLYSGGNYEHNALFGKDYKAPSSIVFGFRQADSYYFSPWLSARVTVDGVDMRGTAALTGEQGTAPTGTVSYRLFSGGSCTGRPVADESVSVRDDGTVPDMAQARLEPRPYSLQTVYDGDGHYNPATSPCAPFHVGPQPASVTARVVAGGPVPGSAMTGSAHAAAVVTGKPGLIPAGTVTYRRFGNGTCTGSVRGSEEVTVRPDGTVPDSATSELGAGAQSYRAEYHGDTSYLPSSSPCVPFEISAGTPGFAAHAEVTGPHSASPDGKGTAHGVATVTRSQDVTPTGEVVYLFYRGNTCNTDLESIEYVKLRPDGTVPDSETVRLPVGSYSFVSTYIGDPHYKSRSIPCAPFTVSPPPGPDGLSVTSFPETVSQNAIANRGYTLGGTGLSCVDRLTLRQTQNHGKSVTVPASAFTSHTATAITFRATLDWWPPPKLVDGEIWASCGGTDSNHLRFTGGSGGE